MAAALGCLNAELVRNVRASKSARNALATRPNLVTWIDVTPSDIVAGISDPGSRIALYVQHLVSPGGDAISAIVGLGAVVQSDSNDGSQSLRLELLASPGAICTLCQYTAHTPDLEDGDESEFVLGLEGGFPPVCPTKQQPIAPPRMLPAIHPSFRI